MNKSKWTHDLYDVHRNSVHQKSYSKTKHHKKEEPGRIKVLLSNIFYETTVEDIFILVEGKFNVKDIIIDYDIAGRSKGTATLYFENMYDASAAVDMLNGYTHEDSVWQCTLMDKGKYSRGNYVDSYSSLKKRNFGNYRGVSWEDNGIASE